MIGFNWQFLFVLLIFLPAVPIFAQEGITIEMDTDKDVYQNGDYITITGTVSKKQEPTALVGIYDPFGNPAGFYIAEIIDGKNFSVDFLAKAGVNFKVDGTYSTTAFYAKTKNTIYFDFVEKLESSNTINENETSSQNTDQADTATAEQADTNTAEQADTNTADTNTPEQADTTTAEQEADTTTTDTTTADQEADTTTADVIITKNTESNYEEKKPVESINDKIIEKAEEKKEINKDTYDNLSVEDIELGKMLNQINLRCDNKSDLTFDISYYDGMGPSLTRLCKFNQALSFYDQELAEKPEDPEILSNKGAVLSKLGYYNEALVHLDAALEVEPTFVSALNNKANVLYELGHLEEARDSYHQVLQIDPNYELASKNLAYVDLYLANSKIQSPSINSLIKNTLETEPTSDNAEKNITENTKPPNIFEQITSMFSGIANALFG